MAPAEPCPNNINSTLSGTSVQRAFEVLAAATSATVVLFDANGQVVMDIDAGGAKTVYVMAEIDGRIYSSGAINITVP